MTALAKDLFVEGREQMILASSLQTDRWKGSGVKKEVNGKKTA